MNDETNCSGGGKEAFIESCGGHVPCFFQKEFVKEFLTLVS